MPKKAIILPAEKVCVVSTGHITEGDMGLLAEEAISHTRDCPRVVTHQYGWFICLTSCKSHIRSNKVALRKAGFSKAFLRLFDMACKQGFSFIDLDSGGERVEGLPFYFW